MQLIVKIGGFGELQNIKLGLSLVMPTKACTDEGSEASRLMCNSARSEDVDKKPTKNYPPLPGFVLSQTRAVTDSNYHL